MLYPRANGSEPSGGRAVVGLFLVTFWFGREVKDGQCTGGVEALVVGRLRGGVWVDYPGFEQCGIRVVGAVGPRQAGRSVKALAAQARSAFRYRIAIVVGGDVARGGGGHPVVKHLVYEGGRGRVPLTSRDGGRVRGKAVLVMSSGGKMLTSLRLLLRARFDRVGATRRPGRVVSVVGASPVSIVVLSVGFSTKVGGNGRKLC